MSEAAPTTAEERLQAFLADAGSAELWELEQLRQRTRRRLVVNWAVVIVAGGLALLAVASRLPGAPLLLALGLVAAGSVGHATVAGRYRRAFKGELIGRLVHAFDPGLHYRATGRLGQAEVAATQLFPAMRDTEYVSEDLVQGSFAGVDLRFAELRVFLPIRLKLPGKRKPWFEGLFFVADFHKHFSGETYVLPDQLQYLFGSIGQALQSRTTRHGELVKLEDPEFERYFATYATDPIEARYILSSDLMSRISAFRERTGILPRLAFRDSRMALALPLQRDLFEPDLARPTDDPAIYRAFWADLELATGLITQLKLDTRIWTKT